jgi:hypothetical protein
MRGAFCENWNQFQSRDGERSVARAPRPPARRGNQTLTINHSFTMRRRPQRDVHHAGRSLGRAAMKISRHIAASSPLRIAMRLSLAFV